MHNMKVEAMINISNFFIGPKIVCGKTHKKYITEYTGELHLFNCFN